MKAIGKLALLLFAAQQLCYAETLPRKHVDGIVPVPGSTQAGATVVTPTPSPTPGRAQAGTTPNPTSATNAERTEGKPGGGCPEKHTLQAFAQVGSAEHPSADPAGGVYYLARSGEKHQIYHLSAPQTEPEPLPVFPEGVSFYALSPDGEKILIATPDQASIWEPKARRLTKLLFRPVSAVWDSGSRWLALTTSGRAESDLDLYRYDLAEKKAILLAPLHGHNEVSDISPDGKHIAITHSLSSTEGEILLWDKGSASARPLDLQGRSARFTADSRSLFWLASTKRGFTELCQAMFSDAQLNSLRERKSLTVGHAEVDGLELSPTRNALAFTLNDQGYARLEAYEIGRNGQKGKLILFDNPAGTVLRSPSFSSHEGRGSFFFVKTSSSAPPDLWLSQKGRQAQWTFSNRAIRSQCFVREELVHYPSFDGQSIAAFLYAPNAPPVPQPFIVYLHDGPTSQHRPEYHGLLQYFLERGFGVLAPNYRGSTGYGREFAAADDAGKRPGSVQDVLCGAHWLLQKHYSLPGQLTAYGEGYGGFLVLSSLEKDPTLFSAASEVSGIGDLPKFVAGLPADLREVAQVEYGAPETLKALSPKVANLRIPLLVLDKGENEFQRGQQIVYFFEKNSSHEK